MSSLSKSRTIDMSTANDDADLGTPISPDRLTKIAGLLTERARADGVRCKLFGGVGIRMHCPNTLEITLARRNYKNEIDIVAHPADLLKVQQFFRSFKEIPSLRNYNGDFQRYVCSVGAESRLAVEVFYRPLEFNHSLPLPDFLDSTIVTLSATDLLLSKLAIVEIRRNDLIDISALLAEHRLASEGNNETIRTRWLASLWCKGWSGWCLAKTCTDNIGKTHAWLMEKAELPGPILDKVQSELNTLTSIVKRCRKSLCWKTRAAIGTRLRWYAQAEALVEDAIAASQAPT